MRVVRIYHAGRDSSHRARERALVAAGAEVTLIVPAHWPENDSLHDEPFEVIELPVHRAGDVNRHRFVDPAAVLATVTAARPDVVDLHEEPVSAVTRQLLPLFGPTQAVVGYTAQNIDKRWPPPFAGWERAALRRLAAVYPCSRQAASVVRGKGFAGSIAVVPLGVDPAIFSAVGRRPGGAELRLTFVGRLVEEKGVLDAVRVLAALRQPARLRIAGDGPLAEAALALAAGLGVGRATTLLGQLYPTDLADLYRDTDVLLVPSRATPRWVEQYGRVVTEARACGAAAAGYATGSLPEVIGAHELLVPDGDVAALAAVVTAAPAQAGPAQAGPVPTWDEVAAAQLELYERALRPEASRPAGRAVAVAEFGPTAAVPGGRRPFALPLLRGDTAASRTLAAAFDRLGRGD
ncbi:glycosyltransferase family 4 protein [Jatrophihabitans sp.]|uniref:glycosyltransferase family 4 protein n=1 Tax=Jatrophihabitans sp. TaxID=1932789 RepID=UPI0030C65BF7|nr:hypothetical protein [Jatrophihabitans sp.]